MSIFDLLNEQRSKQQLVTSEKAAWDMFVRQKVSIEAISKTNGYKEIVDYWRREKAACQERLRSMKSEDLKEAQGKLNLACNFLEFLENILSANLDVLQSNTPNTND